MDPLSIGFGVAGVLPLVAKTIVAAKRYMSDVKGASATITSLITQLESLESTIKSLATLLKEDSGRHGIPKFESSSVLVTCITSCRTKMTTLCAKLELHLQKDSPLRSRGRALLWPLNKSEHKETLDELRGYTSCMQFALSIDNCRLLARSADDVLVAIRRQQESVQAVRQAVESHGRDLDGQTRMLKDERQAETREKLLEWVATGAIARAHSQRHLALKGSRTEGTGSWLLKREEFVEWRKGTEESGVLWCSGIQGSGKTNLTSIILDYLLDGEPAKLAYFYFDHQESASQTPLALWTSILRQYLQRLPEIPQCVLDVYERSHKSGDSLPLHECQRLLLEIANDAEPVSPLFLVLDALDECDSPAGRRREVLKFLGKLCECPSIRVLVTSRPHMQDISALLDDFPKVEIEAQKEDLRTYLTQEVEDGGIYDIADEDFVTTLIDTLADRAHGMFLLPVLQLRTVMQEPTIGAMEDALADLSHSLAGAFEETIKRIQRLPAARSRLGMDSLLYIVHSKRPMTSGELRDALAIQDGDAHQKEVRVKHRPVMKMILECCQGLVMIDHDTDHVKVAHYAIQEYLQSNVNLFPSAPMRIATSCMRYLLFDTFEDGPWPTEERLDEVIGSYPFLVYAAQNWGNHTYDTQIRGDHAYDTDPEDDKILQPVLSAFFSNQTALAISIQITRFERGYHEGYWNPTECLSYSSLHAAACYGLTDSVTRILDDRRHDVNVLTDMGTTPIILAAADGRIDTMRLLLERGADPRLSNWYGDALNCAVEAGEVKAIRELVSWGMDPNGQKDNSRRKSPISCALDRDSVDALETLVELGANQSPMQWFRTAKLAVFEGQPRVLGLMLERGWVSIRMHDARSLCGLLHYAALREDHRSLELLLAMDGAADEVNFGDIDGSTPLDYAYVYMNRIAIQMLEAAGGERRVEVVSVAEEVGSTEDLLAKSYLTETSDLLSAESSEEARLETELELAKKIRDELRLAPEIQAEGFARRIPDGEDTSTVYVVPIPCPEPDCNSWYEYPAVLRKHRLHHHTQAWKCPELLCEYHNGWMNRRERDRCVNDEHTKYACDFKLCTYESTSVADYQQHMENEHKWEYSLDETIRGDVGPRPENEAESFERAMAIVADTPSEAAPLSGDIFGQRASDSAYSADLAPKCLICGKEFLKQSDVAKHAKTHNRPTRKRLYKCSEPRCKFYVRGFPTERERDHHVRDNHQKEPVYKGKSYWLELALLAETHSPDLSSDLWQSHDFYDTYDTETATLEVGQKPESPAPGPGLQAANADGTELVPDEPDKSDPISSDVFGEETGGGSYFAADEEQKLWDELILLDGPEPLDDMERAKRKIAKLEFHEKLCQLDAAREARAMDPTPKICQEPGCNKEFKRECDLTKHAKTHSRPWKCPEPLCKYYELGWPTGKERDRHVNDKHNKEIAQTYKCEFKLCPYESKRESNTKQHMEKAHGAHFTYTKSSALPVYRPKNRAPKLGLPVPDAEPAYGTVLGEETDGGSHPEAERLRFEAMMERQRKKMKRLEELEFGPLGEPQPLVQTESVPGNSEVTDEKSPMGSSDLPEDAVEEANHPSKSRIGPASVSGEDTKLPDERKPTVNDVFTTDDPEPPSLPHLLASPTHAEILASGILDADVTPEPDPTDSTMPEPVSPTVEIGVDAPANTKRRSFRDEVLVRLRWNQEKWSKEPNFDPDDFEGPKTLDDVQEELAFIKRVKGGRISQLSPKRLLEESEAAAPDSHDTSWRAEERRRRKDESVKACRRKREFAANLATRTTAVKPTTTS